MRQLAPLVRRLTGPVVFPKRLPAAFGRSVVFVTTRSDLRLIRPGFDSAASDLLQVADRYVNPGDCVWDIGSNLGIFTVCAAHRAGRSGRVFSLEADPRYAELQNRTIGRLPDNCATVRVLCAAIAQDLDILDFAIPARGHARSHLTMVEGNSAGTTEYTKQVVSLTGDFLLAHWEAPDFVKMDVEGAEWLALQGSRRLLEEVRPTFYIEVSESTRGPVSELFRTHDYRFFKLDSARGEIGLEACGFNTLCRPAERC